MPKYVALGIGQMLGSATLQIPQNFAFCANLSRSILGVRPIALVGVRGELHCLPSSYPSKSSMHAQITVSIGSLSGSLQDIPQGGFRPCSNAVKHGRCKHTLGMAVKCGDVVAPDEAKPVPLTRRGKSRMRRGVLRTMQEEDSYDQ